MWIIFLNIQSQFYFIFNIHKKGDFLIIFVRYLFIVNDALAKTNEKKKNTNYNGCLSPLASCYLAIPNFLLQKPLFYFDIIFT